MSVKVVKSPDFVRNTLHEFIRDEKTVDEILARIPREVLEEVAESADNVRVHRDDSEVCDGDWRRVTLVYGEFEVTRRFTTTEHHGPDVVWVECKCYRPVRRPAVARVWYCVGAGPDACYVDYHIWL